MEKMELFKKIKSSVLKGAKTSAFKIEEAAKIGKLHLQIISEKKKLNEVYQKIGQETAMAITDKKLSELESSKSINNNLQKIEEISEVIESIEGKLSGNNAI